MILYAEEDYVDFEYFEADFDLCFRSLSDRGRVLSLRVSSTADRKSVV